MVWPHGTFWYYCDAEGIDPDVIYRQLHCTGYSRKYLPLADGQYNTTFRIKDQADDGSSLWSETQEVQVLQGVINTQLGS